MRETMLIVAGLSAVGAVICGVLGYVVFTKPQRKHRVDPRQGMSRAMFLIFLAAAIGSGVIGLLLP